MRMAGAASVKKIIEVNVVNEMIDGAPAAAVAFTSQLSFQFKLFVRCPQRLFHFKLKEWIRSSMGFAHHPFNFKVHCFLACNAFIKFVTFIPFPFRSFQSLHFHE